MSEQRSGPGRKPDVKIAIKPKQPKEAKRVYIAAGWREDGKLRLKFDRDIAAIVLTDGTRLECADLYIDLYENDGDGPRGRPGNGTQQAPAGAPAASGGADFGDDDVPFTTPFTLPI
jgi:hypothetical protein